VSTPSACVALQSLYSLRQFQEYGQETAKWVSMRISISVKIQWKSQMYLKSYSIQHFEGPLSRLHDSDLGFVKPTPFALHITVIASVIEFISF
jgi:hypothetical protein